MSVFNLSQSKIFQAMLYDNIGPLSYDDALGTWNAPPTLSYFASNSAHVADSLLTSYVSTYMGGNASDTQKLAIVAAINVEIASYPPPNNDYNDSTWLNQILSKANIKLARSGFNLNYYGNSYGYTVPGVKKCILDPLAQNFFVDASVYPNGVFLSSVALFFATKDATVPVSIQIISVTNGYPDTSKPITGSIVYKKPQDINIPAGKADAGIGPQTKFYFDYPIYLSPGQYSIMIQSNSNLYTLYASVMGKVEYGTNKTVLSPTYSGVFFKSQNASTWVPATGTGTTAQQVSECLCFVLNICQFSAGAASFQLSSLASGSNTIVYDLINLTSSDITFNSLDYITYQASTKSLSSGSKSSFTSLLHNKNTQLSTRQKHKSADDITLRFNMSNSDQWTSPLVDLHRVSNILVTNHLSPYYSANTVAECLPGLGVDGGASSRYITKRVTLQNDFNSTGLTVYVDVNRQPGTKIEVYYKVMSQYDNNLFDDNPYVLMNPILIPGNDQVPNTGVNDWVRDTYQALDIQYNDVSTDTLYTDFNKFAIKICFYSNNPAIAPQIKNFRAIATV